MMMMFSSRPFRICSRSGSLVAWWTIVVLLLSCNSCFAYQPPSKQRAAATTAVIESPADYEHLLSSSQQQSSLLLLYFRAPYCRACRKFTPRWQQTQQFLQMAKQQQRVDFVEWNLGGARGQEDSDTNHMDEQVKSSRTTTRSPARDFVDSQLGIQALPTVQFYRAGRLCATWQCGSSAQAAAWQEELMQMVLGGSKKE